MPDPVTEVVLAEADLDALVAPTSSDVWREMHGHSTEAVAAIAAKLAKAGGGGGGSLPAWWTVDSTPGSESLTLNGELVATFNRAQRALYTGATVVTVADGSNGYVTWDNLGDGEPLLDISDLGIPTMVTAGIYAVTVTVVCQSAITAGGGFHLKLRLDINDADSVTQETFGAGNAFTGEYPICSLSNVYYIPAGGAIGVRCFNYDGAASLDFRLEEGIIQRLL